MLHSDRQNFVLKGPVNFSLEVHPPEEAQYVMAEIHEGICSSHLKGKALSRKVMRAGYYWP